MPEIKKYISESKKINYIYETHEIYIFPTTKYYSEFLFCSHLLHPNFKYFKNLSEIYIYSKGNKLNFRTSIYNLKYQSNIVRKNKII